MKNKLVAVLLLSCLCGQIFSNTPGKTVPLHELKERLAVEKELAEVTKDKDRETQKAILLLGGSAALLALSKILQNKAGLGGLGRVFNLTAGEFQAACALASTVSAIGVVAKDSIAEPCKSAAWRIPLMAAVGGLISHNTVHAFLGNFPMGIGDWFKANPPSDKKGIFAIYAIFAWHGLKPSLDKLENWASKKVSHYSQEYWS